MINKFYLLIIPLLFSFFLNAQRELISLDQHQIESISTKSQKGEFFVLPFEHIGDVYYKAKETSIIDGPLKKKHPNLRTFDLINLSGQLEGKLVLTKQKVYATFASNEGFQSIYPGRVKDQYFRERGFNKSQSIKCSVEELKENLNDYHRSDIGYYSYGDDLQSFRLAVITTGEFYEQHGNNDADVMADIVSTISSLNLIFEREMSLNFTLSGRVFMYTDPETDPFTPDQNVGASLRTTQSGIAFNNQFDAAAYDLGITFNAYDDGWSGGGLAVIKAACSTNTGINGPSKAKIWAASLGIPDNSFISVVAHEIGHAFGARHTMNTNSSVCIDALSDGHSYEIGSGNTLMSYGGLCGEGQDYVIPDETINNYFHFASLYSMAEYVRTLSCQIIFETDNEPPVLNINPCNLESFKVPLNTPFRLKADATDPQGDALNYCWEQFDEDGPGTPTAGFIGDAAAKSPNGPIFRGYAPSDSPERSFPRFFNYYLSDPFESLSQVARDITMRCTVRDRNSEGGIFSSDEITVEVTDAGPFVIEIDSLLDTIYGGETINLTWNDLGISDLCENVDVHLISLTNPDIIIPVGINVPFSDQGIEYFVAPGFSIDGNFHFKVECHVADCFSFYNYSRPFYSRNNCSAPESFYICGIDDVTANIGDESLNYQISNLIGIPEYQNDFLIDDSDALHHFVRYDLNGDCMALNLPSGNPVNRNFEFVNFQVAESGRYTFDNLGEFAAIFVYEQSMFDVNNLCAGLIDASVTESENNPGTVISTFYKTIFVDLEACTSYVLGISSFETGITNTVNITGESLISVEESTEVGGDIFYVVEDIDGTITHISKEADFTLVRQGQYEVYAINVEAETFNPADFIGKRLIDFGLDGICIDRSSNTTDMLLINTLPDEDNDGYHTDEDCNDNDENINPGAPEIANNDIDENCDGELLVIDVDGDGFNSAIDCDDTNPDINPEASEIPNNDVDENCDGEALVIDEDGDGFNSDEDCDDTNPDIHPDAEEIPNNPIDENCDGVVAEYDADGDGFNSEVDCDDMNAAINPDAEEIANNDIDENCDGEVLIIDADGDGFNSAEDCDDTNPDVNPDAEEIINNDIDEDCDGIAQSNDADMDGFTTDVDCDDTNPDINPDAEEIPNNDIDEDCDGEALVIDADGDGFNSDDDCNDMDPNINPDAEEIPNNTIDENCNGEIGFIDIDQDGFNSDDDCDDNNPDINPDAEEIPNNGIDENCDGLDMVSSTEEIIYSKVHINPNPVVDILRISSEERIIGIKVYNSSGVQLISEKLDTRDCKIKLTHIPPGLYFVSVNLSEDERPALYKIIKL